jgi:glycosyltransferase involved in cell wall biosynthesis
MNFSICIIAKNEANTLPRCIASLKEFIDKDGVVCVLDTGSTDDTVKIAKDLGCKVEEVGEKFIVKIDKILADKINKRFIVGKEPNIVKGGDKLFDFASARNYCASLAPTDMVIAVDADEYFTTLNLDEVSKLVDDGIKQFETHFIFAHDQYGKPAIQFIQSRFYNKKDLKYTGIVHEVLTGDGGMRVPLPKDIYMLEHKQEKGKSHRTGYLIGLALDCFQNPDKDRQSHYFARELFYTGRYNSAIKEFKRHITLNGWRLEAAQSMIYIGDCYGKLNQPEKQVEWYNKSFYFDSNRRAALIRLAEFYKHNKNFKATATYASASLELPLIDYYSNDARHYAEYPHKLLYWAKGWYGDIEGAKHHIKKALEYQPYDSDCLRDLRYYYDLPKVSIILPTIGGLYGIRENSLRRCTNSIKALNYPEDKIEVIIVEDKPRKGVAARVKEGYEKATGDYICFAADDIEFTQDSMILAVWDSITKDKRLVAFDTGVRNKLGYICEHFIIKRSLVEEIGEIFSTKLNHYCMDDLLWAKADRLNESMVSDGHIIHYHYSRIGSNIPMDEINKLTLDKVEEDRRIFKEELEKLDNKFTGERVVPNDMNNAVNIFQDHLARYNFALEYVVNKKVLDAACGTGYGVDLMSGVAEEVSGCDIDIDYAIKKYHNNFYKEDLNKPINCENYDVITSFETIEHLEYPDRFLNWVGNHCKTFIFSIPVDAPSKFHKQVWNIKKIKNLINKHFTNTNFYAQERMNFYSLNGSAVYVVGVAQGKLDRK